MLLLRAGLHSQVVLIARGCLKVEFHCCFKLKFIHVVILQAINKYTVTCTYAVTTLYQVISQNYQGYTF